MDGKGRCLDNVFVERLWRTVKYEEIYLKSYRSQIEAYANLGTFFQCKRQAGDSLGNLSRAQ